MELPLSTEISALVHARNALRQQYASSGRDFTLDGNLVGDLGEALAAEFFGIKLAKRNDAGIDGFTVDKKTVQVKATGKNYGPAFRMVDARADYLLFFAFDFENCKAKVIFNGPEEAVRRLLPERWSGQRRITMARMMHADTTIDDEQRLKPII